MYEDIPHESAATRIHLGIAGWNIRREHADKFSATGTHLERYARVFNAVEINSCFYRPHRVGTYERWAASVPKDFRFAVKLPKLITHELRLTAAVPVMERFLQETSGLGEKRGPILVQLPPSLVYDEQIADSFFTELRHRFSGDVVLEARHPLWFSDEVNSLLVSHRIARVVADPPPVPAAAVPAGYGRVVYLRLHGSPRVYYSAYTDEDLGRVSDILTEQAARGIFTWCIFDNTALGAATADALTVKARLTEKERAAI